ncbi:MAG: hypothetical protein IBX61_08805 [Thermoleophilia bacterium]|nr:hypothetical protein [Thermoleophilia bacterium]
MILPLVFNILLLIYVVVAQDWPVQPRYLNASLILWSLYVYSQFRDLLGERAATAVNLVTFILVCRTWFVLFNDRIFIY